jgi:hypothetical protein
MSRALVFAMVLAIGPPIAVEAHAQGARPMAAAPAPGGGVHRDSRRHRRADPVARWERGLARARARGDVTGRDPWSSYGSLPAQSLARSQFPEGRLPGSRLWPDACWGWRADCATPVVPRPPVPPPAAAAASRAEDARGAAAPPARRRLDARPVVRGPDNDAPKAYAHRVWRR